MRDEKKRIYIYILHDEIKISNGLYILILLIEMVDRRRFTRGRIESRE